MREAADNSSAKAPSPLPSTRPIRGRSFVFERMNFAARSARANSSLERAFRFAVILPSSRFGRSEEHTSELQSRLHLVCRLLLEKKKKNDRITVIAAFGQERRL